MTKPMLNERKIVSEILLGKEKALRLFYKYFQPSLLTYVRRKVGNEADVEEILQDTFLATLEALRDFSFRSSLFTFICSIANHKVIDFYRRKKIKNIFFSRLPEAESLLASLWGPENEFDDELLKSRIRQTFAKLTPKYSLILKLKYIYGYSVLEIARKLSISFKSAESQLFRARQAFVANFAIYEE